jgi:aspartate kinase
MSVILASANISDEKEAQVLTRIKTELKPDDISVEHGLALIMVVGEGMHYTPGMAAKATGAFREAGVNLEMINQGASEISMMFAVKDADREKAIRALGTAFFNI